MGYLEKEGREKEGDGGGRGKAARQLRAQHPSPPGEVGHLNNIDIHYLDVARGSRALNRRCKRCWNRARWGQSSDRWITTRRVVCTTRTASLMTSCRHVAGCASASTSRCRRCRK